MFNDDERHVIVVAKSKMRGALMAKLGELPDSMASLLKHAVLSGGATASLIHNEEPNDWDLYFKSNDEMTNFLILIKNSEELQQYVADINEKYMETLINGKLVTVNAVTLKNKLQVIIKQTHDLRGTFDFIHCLPYYELDTDRFYISKTQFESIKTKKLVFNPNRADNIASHRIEKFKQRGWTI